MKFVLDENNNRHEALDKEGVEALLAEAIQSGQLPSVDDDTAFVTKLKDPHTGLTHRVAFLTQAKYNELKANQQLIAGAYYFITDDTTADDLEDHMDQIDENVDHAMDAVNEVIDIIDTDAVTFESVYPTEDVEEDFDMEHFIRWAYPRAMQKMQGKTRREMSKGLTFTMYDAQSQVAQYKGYFIYPNAFLVAVSHLGLSQYGSGLVWELVDSIVINDNVANFDDMRMADIDMVAEKSDKPTNVGTASADGSYISNITTGGLYALRVKMSEESNMVFTLMISVVSAVDGMSTISYLTNNGDRLYAEYTASDHRITAYYHNGTTYANAYFVGLAKLVAKY